MTMKPTKKGTGNDNDQDTGRNSVKDNGNDDEGTDTAHGGDVGTRNAARQRQRTRSHTDTDTGEGDDRATVKATRQNEPESAAGLLTQVPNSQWGGQR